MRIDSGVSLRSVRADWLRVQSEVAWLRMLFAADAYKKALARQAKFNPYHDEAGRFTTADGAVGPGSGRDGRVRLAQAGEGSGYPINILEEDALGGHTFAEHVGKREEYLIGRIAGSRPSVPYIFGVGRKRAGSFTSLEAANKLVSSVIADPGNQAKLTAFANGSFPFSLPVLYLYPTKPFSAPTGYEAYAPDDRTSPRIRSTNSVEVRVLRTNGNSRGYYVHSAYPINED